MIILIDGYNFLKSITGTKFITDHQLHSWLMLFDQYMHKKPNKILIVFDAGPSFFASCEQEGSVEVCYAGQHQTADDWIKSWLEKNNQKDILLVSSDREIRNKAQELGVTSISSQDFYKVFKEALKKQEHVEKFSDFAVYKTKENEDSDEYLDGLMLAAAKDIKFINHKHPEVGIVGQGKKISKKDKFLLKKIDKV